MLIADDQIWLDAAFGTAAWAMDEYREEPPSGDLIQEWAVIFRDDACPAFRDVWS